MYGKLVFQFWLVMSDSLVWWICLALSWFVYTQDIRTWGRKEPGEIERNEWHKGRKQSGWVCMTMVWYVHISSKNEQPEKSITIKCWTLTSVQELNSFNRTLFSSRVTPLFTNQGPYVRFLMHWMQCFLVPRLEYMVPLIGQENHPIHSHWIFPLGIWEGWSESDF